MTAESFAALIQDHRDNETVTIHTASHYDLSPDVYGLDDGYAWAFATTGDDGEGNATRNPRQHLADGGEWPYYIAAIPTPDPRSADRYTAAGILGGHKGAAAAEAAEALTAGRILETYCEGDLTAYVFETREDRDAAAKAWRETQAEYAARLIEESPHYYAPTAPESFAAAVVQTIADTQGENRQGITLDADSVAEALELFSGEWDSAADYWMQWVDDTTDADARTAMGSLFDYIDWEKYADDRDSDGGMAFHAAPEGHVYVFHTER